MKPGRRRTRPEAIGGLVPSVLGELGLERTQAILRIAERWEEVVGPDAAAHSRPHLVRGRVLEVEAESSVWVQTLRLHAPRIVARLGELFGAEAPRELWLRVGIVRETPHGHA